MEPRAEDGGVDGEEGRGELCGEEKVLEQMCDDI